MVVVLSTLIAAGMALMAGYLLGLAHGSHAHRE